MSQPNFNDDRAREAATARADLERRAAEQGIRPFDAADWLAEPQTEQQREEVTREVDDFLGLLREWRDTPSHRSAG